MASLTFYGGVGEIGGNKILLEDGDDRIFLDFGLSFNQSGMYFAEFLQPKKYNGVVDFLEMGLLPRLTDMGGLYRQDYLQHTDMETRADAAYNGVFLSHAHADHAAYIHFLRADIPIYASEITRRILASMEETSGGGFSEFLNINESFRLRPNKRGEGMTKVKGDEGKVARTFHGVGAGERVTIGGLGIDTTPVNHSIPGAMGLIIQTSAGTVVYTGDLRFHGHGGELTQQFVERAAASRPTALICEGTRLRLDQDDSLSEHDVQQTIADVVRKTKNLVIADYPWKDIERLTSFYEVAKSTGRKLALSLKQAYLVKQLEGTDAGAPPLDDGNIVIYIDKKSWGVIDRPGCPQNIVEQDYKTWERQFLGYSNRVTCSDIHRNQGDFIIRIDFFDLTDLINIRPHPGSCYIRSVTEPFDEEMAIEKERVDNWLNHFGLYPYVQAHASGHASGPEIKRLIEEIGPGTVFPVHTEHPDLFAGIVPHGVRVEMPELGKNYNL